jgi:hypothetical protein
MGGNEWTLPLGVILSHGQGEAVGGVVGFIKWIISYPYLAQYPVGILHCPTRPLDITAGNQGQRQVVENKRPALMGGILNLVVSSGVSNSPHFQMVFIRTMRIIPYIDSTPVDK